LASGGRKNINLPHDITSGLLGGIGKVLSPLIPNAMNEQAIEKANPFGQMPEHNYAQMLGQEGEGTLMDKLIQGGAEYAPDIVAGKEILKAPLSFAADKLPVFKSMAVRPYKQQMKILTEKNLLQGYKPNAPDVFEASRLLKSQGMTIPHAAIDEAVAQTLEGNYKPWFNLQSTVRSEARRLSKKVGVNNTLGEKLHKLAEKMHTEIGEAQAERGAPEAEALMHKGKERLARHYKIAPYAKKATGVTAGIALPTTLYKIFKGLSK